MEEELAALQGKGAKKKRAKEAARGSEPARSSEPSVAAPEPASAKRRLAGLFSRKPTEDVPGRGIVPVPAPPEERILAHGMTPAPMAAPLAETMSAVEQPRFLAPTGRWRQEGKTWIVRGDAEPQVLRRILDAEGRVVSEEPAGREILASAPEPRESRLFPDEPAPDEGAGAAPDEGPERPLHTLAERLGARKEKEKKRKGLFGRKKGEE